MMENNDYKNKKHSLKPEIKGDQGLNLSYDKAELEQAFPNLVSEIYAYPDSLSTISIASTGQT